MTSVTDPFILWLLGALVTILTLLVGAIYMSVRSDQRRTDSNVKEVKEEWDDKFCVLKEDIGVSDRDFWSQINSIRDKVNELGTNHRVLCQKHEDQLNDIIKRVEESKNEIYKWRNLLTETRSTLENRMMVIERSIKVLAELVHTKIQ